MTGIGGLADALIVDTHVHVWPHGMVHPAQREQVPMEAAPADLVATLDAGGVGAAVVCPAMVYPDNGYVLGFAGTLPERILAVVLIDPRDRAAVELVPCYAAQGAVGVRVNAHATPLESDEDLAGLDAMVDAASAAGLVIQWTVPLPSAGLIERAAARARNARQVLDHLGLPVDASDLTALDRIRALAAIPGLNVKLSGMYNLSRDRYPYADTWPWVEAVVDAFGPQRTMWGSDWPFVGEYGSYTQQLTLIEQMPFLDTAARRSILRDTAVQVWSRP